MSFKKPVIGRGQAQWQYKEQAIVQAAAAFRASLNAERLNVATLVLIPPSKAKTDPLYDDRLVRMLKAIRATPALDVCELIIQTKSTDAVHDLPTRPRPEHIEAIYQVDTSLKTPAPTVIGLFDDILTTTGAHFRAAQAVLQKAFQGVRIIGLFIARRVPESSNIEDFL